MTRPTRPTRRDVLRAGAAAGAAPLVACVSTREIAPRVSADLVVYGGTSGGVAAAVRGARAGLSVVLVEPTAHVGGMTTSGLGATDVGDRRAIGGLARELYRRVRDHYADDGAWTLGERSAGSGWREHADAMWRFEPHVAEAIFDAMLAEAGVRVLRRERLDLDRAGAALDLERAGDGEPLAVRALRLESGLAVAGRAFVDASYEGDLMARAGVPYTVGREGNDVYGETLNGVQTRNAVHHQFVAPVDPYVTPGDPSSGLLPEIHAGPPGDEGSGDARVQAYCFRTCFSDRPDARVPFERPDGYDERRYELLLRHFEAGATVVPWNAVPMPNRKTDTNNNRAFSSDHVGASDGYPEAGHAERAAIAREHERYQRGFLWTLANHPRVPAEIRAEASRFGLAADEFTDNGNWPHQIYVREARRMVGDYVVTEHDCLHAARCDDPIGMGAYNMDSHHVQRYVDEHGHARNEGDVEVGPAGPYGISYRAIVPPRGAVRNLLASSCVSASHVAFGSIRMEPVFQVLGHSAATAAALALELGCAVQDVPYGALRARLLAEGQVLPDA